MAEVIGSLFRLRDLCLYIVALIFWRSFLFEQQRGTVVDRADFGPFFKLFWNCRLKLYNLGFFGLNITLLDVFNHFGS